MVRAFGYESEKTMADTLDDVKKRFDLYPDSLVIRSPGKFEGEPAYAPYFFGVWLDGGSDFDDDYSEQGGVLVSSFDVTDEDRERFPNMLDTVERVELWEDSNGFVHTSCHSICPCCNVSHHGFMGAHCAACKDVYKTKTS